MAKKIIALLAFALIGCNKPVKVYECKPGDSRLCKCLNGELGAQECSKGPVFTNWTPREWIPCTCCWTVYENDMGPYKIEKNDASGCWSDTYDPATPTYDIGDTTDANRGSSDSEARPPRDNSKDN